MNDEHDHLDSELQRLIRGCPEPMMLPQAGHFVQEHGEAIAQAAAAHFIIR